MTDPPPFLPPGWHAVPASAEGGSQALVLRQRSGRRLATAAGVAVLAIVLAVWTGDLALGDRAPQDRPWTWIMGAAAAGGAWMALRLARVTAVWQLTPGCLLIGEIRARGGAWHHPPSRAEALEVTPYEDDGLQYHRLSAVIPTGRTVRHETLYEGPPDGGAVRALGSWLAARADIPLTDRSGDALTQR